MIKMNIQNISQKLQPLSNELILSFVSGGTASVFEDSENITNIYSPELLKINGIKYFHFVDTITGFANLKFNWDSYNADEISKTAINKALETLNYIQTKGLLSTDIMISVFPMRDGGIQFEFDGESICAELEINPNAEMKFVLFDDTGHIIDSFQLFEVSELPFLLEEALYA